MIPGLGIAIPKPDIAIPKPDITIPRPGIAIPRPDTTLSKPGITIPKPEITIDFDVDQNAAAAQRAKQFADAETSRRLVAPAHVSFPGVGHIRADNQGYAWVPVDYR